MHSPPHLPLRGLAFGCSGAFLFTLQDAAFKYLGDDFSVGQIIFLRSFATLLVAAVWVGMATDMRHALRMEKPRLFAFSLAANIGAWFCFYTGLSALPLTVAICIFFLTPVVIALLSIPVLGEKPTWRQWLSLVCGLGGVVVITNPFAPDDPTNLIAVAWVLASVVLWASVAVTTRALQPSMSLRGTLLYSTVGFLLVSGALQPAGWREPTTTQLIGMVSLGIISAGAQCCVWAAYRSARAAVVATAEYSALIWAALFGWLFWDERQTLRDIIGIALIVGAGAIVLIQHPQKTPHHP